MWNTSGRTRVHHYLICSLFVCLTVVALEDIRRQSGAHWTRLPSLITPDARSRPQWYYGNTAAEFVVTAGIDRSKSSVRIKRLESHPLQRISKQSGFKSFRESGARSHFPSELLDKDEVSRLRPSASRKSFNQRRKRDASESVTQSSGREENENVSSDYSGIFTEPEKLLRVIKSLITLDPSSSEEKSPEITPRASESVSRAFRPSNNTGSSLQQLILPHLLRAVLSLRNNTARSDVTQTSGRKFSPVFRERAEHLTPAEQRQYGIIVSPSRPHPSGMRSSIPVIRVLKGKLISLPQLPPELLPIIMGTYNPTYTNVDDQKLTENIIDSAIYALLQNEDLLDMENLFPQRNRVRLGSATNRKSPSTNFLGPIKNYAPTTKPAFRPLEFQPDWVSGPRCDRLTEEICLDDSDYPSSAIMSSIYKDKAKFDLMYAEIKERKSQVEGLNRKQELAYDYNHYFGHASQTSEARRPQEYGPRGGFVCPSEVHYGRPHRAKNRKGEWKVVVNVGEYTQTLRMERCLVAGQPCKYVVSHMHSKCSQVYSYHRLLVFNKDQGLHIDIFRIPSGCACHIRGKNYYYSQPHISVRDYEEFGGHVESAPSSQLTSESSSSDNRKKNSFSDTLWAILGGGRQAAALAQSPQFLDEVKKQISWTQQLQNFPNFYKQVSPEQVLKQLLEEEDEERTDPKVLQVQRYKNERDHPGAFATHHVPVTVPLREPLPVLPPRKVARVPVTRPKRIFGPQPDGLKRFEIRRKPGIANIVTNVPSVVRSDVVTEPVTPTHRTQTSYATESIDTTTSTAADTTAVTTTTTVEIAEEKEPTSTTSPQVSEESTAIEFGDSTTSSEYDFTDSSSIDEKIMYNHDLFQFAKPDGLPSKANQTETNADTKHPKINFSYHPILEYLSL